MNTSLDYIEPERDPQTLTNHEMSGGPVAFNITQARVEHYAEVVDHLVNTEITRCKASGFTPTAKQVDFLRKEITRAAVIRHDVVAATKIKIRESSILNETDDLLFTRT